MRDAAVTLWLPREPLSCRLRKQIILGNFAIWTVSVLEKVLLSCFRLSSQNSVADDGDGASRHVGAHPDGH